MIAARLHKDDGVCILLVLEPGNIEKLKQGMPIHKFLSELVPELPLKVELLFAYSPDVPWVAEQMAKLATKDATELARILHESLSREPVVVRDRTAEELKKVM